MRQGPMGERDTWKYSERWTDRLQATGYCSLAYMAQPPLATLRQFDNTMQGTCRHVQQSAGGMLPCVGGAVLQLMASSVHLRGLGWSPPPPDNQLLLRSESRAVTGPTHVQPWTLDTGMLRLVTWFFCHISTLHIAKFYESLLIRC